jgi:hypothetical protein
VGKDTEMSGGRCGEKKKRSFLTPLFLLPNTNPEAGQTLLYVSYWVSPLGRGVAPLMHFPVQIQQKYL